MQPNIIIFSPLIYYIYESIKLDQNYFMYGILLYLFKLADMQTWFTL
jgi:hypothetical protein